MTEAGNQSVLTIADTGTAPLVIVLERFGLQIKLVSDSEVLDGSFWGAPEAGLVGNHLYICADTPVHSALHEACHYVCMSAERRNGLHTNAGGDYDEENAVCYLQILLAEHLHDVGAKRLMKDMDTWGYSFRLGSASRWFNEDAEDARQWLLGNMLIDENGQLAWRLRVG